MAEQGLGLYDISGFGEDVDVGDGVKLRVKGISAKGILMLLLRYPDLQKWLAGQTLAVADIMVQSPDVIAAVIAAGTGMPGDPEAEEIASGIPIEVQMDVVEVIYRRTFRSGFGPFAKRVLALYEHAVAARAGKDPVTKSPPVSQPSLEPDTTTSESGTTLPVK